MRVTITVRDSTTNQVLEEYERPIGLSNFGIGLTHLRVTLRPVEDEPYAVELSRAPDLPVPGGAAGSMYPSLIARFNAPALCRGESPGPWVSECQLGAIRAHVRFDH